jgi:hypothetical protein
MMKTVPSVSLDVIFHLKLRARIVRGNLTFLQRTALWLNGSHRPSRIEFI